MRLLCISNGHGEDVIARRILEAMTARQPDLQLSTLALVGEGHALRSLPATAIGPQRALPSGGFIYMDPRQLLRDVGGGLVQLTWGQWQAMRRWSRQDGVVLAVGDIVPLLFAWGSGLPYCFVPTAKSDYYWRDDQGPLPDPRPRALIWQRWQQSIFDPWDRWLMRHPRCRAVFPRDGLTARLLQGFGAPVQDLGNPMMDGLAAPATDLVEALGETGPRVLLLPGSRPPECWGNWERLLGGLRTLQSRWPGLQALAAIAPSLPLGPLEQALAVRGWTPVPPLRPDVRSSARAEARLHLGRQHFGPFLHLAQLALATAGTATEQAVGLGCPVISFPGPGPQFTAGFAEAQTRLLGSTVTPAPQTAAELLPLAVDLLENPTRRQAIAHLGRQRMGLPGAADRIAATVLAQA